MCGRYALYDTSKLDFEVAHNLIGISYNIAPSMKVPVIVENNEVSLVNWTYKVPWAKNLDIINARSETLEKKPVFRNAKRCIFIANGYYEWLQTAEGKVPYYHTFRTRMMYFGGIFNDYGACIVTRQSQSMKVDVHHRQPVILNYQEFSNWFDLKHNLTCEQNRDLDIYRVSNKVNSPKNNSPDNVAQIF